MEINNESNTRIMIDKLIRMIADERLPVGTRLPSERRLAADYAVARSSVREALSVLRNLGIVEIRQGGGAYVSDLRIEPLLDTLAPLLGQAAGFDHDIREFRLILEVNAVRLAARRGDTGALAVIVTKMTEQMRETSIMAADLDMAFHRELYRLSGNAVLMRVMEGVAYVLRQNIDLNRQRIISGAGDRILVDQHRAIYLAISDHDGEKAARLLREHLNTAQKSEDIL